VGPPRVVVFRETPSLAASIAELLELDGIAVALEPSVCRVLQLGSMAEYPPPSVLVSTSTGYASDLVQDWQVGPFRDADLILIGPRDSDLRSAGRLHVARLPLVPEDFLNLVRGLLAEPRPGGSS
jgi:hypothetical protein